MLKYCHAVGRFQYKMEKERWVLFYMMWHWLDQVAGSQHVNKMFMIYCKHALISLLMAGSLMLHERFCKKLWSGTSVETVNDNRMEISFISRFLHNTIFIVITQKFEYISELFHLFWNPTVVDLILLWATNLSANRFSPHCYFKSDPLYTCRSDSPPLTAEL